MQGDDVSALRRVESLRTQVKAAEDMLAGMKDDDRNLARQMERVSTLRSNLEQQEQLIAPEAAQTFVESQKKIEALPRTAAERQFAAGSPIREALRNPVELAAVTTAESLPSMAEGMVGSLAGPGGLATTMGGSSFKAESAARVVGAMQDQGIDTKNPDAVLAWFSNRAKSQPAEAKADMAALGPAAFDALTAGFAGKILRPLLGSGVAKVAAGTAGEIGVQMTGGAAGSIAANKLAGEPVDWHDVVLEMLGEIAPVETASNLRGEVRSLGRRKRQVAAIPENIERETAATIASAPDTAGVVTPVDQIVQQNRFAVDVAPIQPSGETPIDQFIQQQRSPNATPIRETAQVPVGQAPQAGAQVDEEIRKQGAQAGQAQESGGITSPTTAPESQRIAAEMPAPAIQAELDAVTQEIAAWPKLTIDMPMAERMDSLDAKGKLANRANFLREALKIQAESQVQSAAAATVNAPPAVPESAPVAVQPAASISTAPASGTEIRSATKSAATSEPVAATGGFSNTGVTEANQPAPTGAVDPFSLRRDQWSSTIISPDDTTAAVARFRGEVKNAPEVEVVDNVDWVVNGQGVQGTVRDGKIILNRAYIRNANEASSVLREERAHLLLGTPEAQTQLLRIGEQLDKATLDSLRPQYGDNPTVLLNEWAAKTQRENPNLWQRFVQAVREWLAKVGLVNLTPEQAVRAMFRGLNATAQPQQPSYSLADLSRPQDVEAIQSGADSPAFYERIAPAINRAFVPVSAVQQMAALPPEAQAQLRPLLSRAEVAGEGVEDFRALMASDMTLEEKSSASGFALRNLMDILEWKGKLPDNIERTKADLQAAVERALSIYAAEELNEAEIQAKALLGDVLNKIAAEKAAAGDKAAANQKIAERTQWADSLKRLGQDTALLAKAMRGLAKLVPEARWQEAGNFLDKISSAVPATDLDSLNGPDRFLRSLANALVRNEQVKGVGAGHVFDTLKLLQESENAQEQLLQARLTEDGTLRRFNESFLNDLKSKTPRGFITLLREFAASEAKAKALDAASKRTLRTVEKLRTKLAAQEQAAAFADALIANPDFAGNAQAVIASNDAEMPQYTREKNNLFTWLGPVSGKRYEVLLGVDGAGTRETLASLKELAEEAWAYILQPNADPLKAAYWRKFANDVWFYELDPANNPLSPVRVPALLAPDKMINRWSWGVIADMELQKIPGIQAGRAERALKAWAQADRLSSVKVAEFGEKIPQANRRALRSHRMTSKQWREEVMWPILDSAQSFGVAQLKTGDIIPTTGHRVTKEDTEAVNLQHEYDRALQKIAYDGGGQMAARMNALRVKAGNILRKSVETGPMTMSRRLRQEAVDLAVGWAKAAENGTIDQFLSEDSNWQNLVLAHIFEADPGYLYFGNKARFRRQYQRLKQMASDADARTNVPADLAALSEWIASRYNETAEQPVEAAEVRKQIESEISGYMKAIRDYNQQWEKPTGNVTDFISRENSFTQERGQKVAPGGMYQYGFLGPRDLVAKHHEAMSWHTQHVIEEMRGIYDALGVEEVKLRDWLQKKYGGTGLIAQTRGRWQINKDRMTQGAQMTYGEVVESRNRIGKVLKNIEAIQNRSQRDFFGNELLDRYQSQIANLLSGGVLTLNPGSIALNLFGAQYMQITNMAKLTPNAYTGATGASLKTIRNALMEMVNLMIRGYAATYNKVKGGDLIRDKLEAIQAKGIPEGIIERNLVGVIERALIDEDLIKIGVKDDVNVGAEMTAQWATLLDALNDPDRTTLAKYGDMVGLILSPLQAGYRKLGPRPVDNFVNAEVVPHATEMERLQEVRAMKTFNRRLETDETFRRAYEQSGGDLNRFLGLWRGDNLENNSAALTPQELLGGFRGEFFTNIGLGNNPERAAYELKELFQGNTPLEVVMLRYWWNRRNGDTTAKLLTAEERNSLIFALAEHTNLTTVSNRPQFFSGSRMRQKFGTFLKYPLWATARNGDLYSRLSTQRTTAEAMPLLVMAVALAGLLGMAGQEMADELKELLFRQVSNKPTFANATDNAERLKIFASYAALNAGGLGSGWNLLNDTARKNGYQNPIFLANVANDAVRMVLKMYQTKSVTQPALDFLARYQAPFRPFINRLDSREGMVEQRNAANALLAATPSSMESVRRQGGGDGFRSTPAGAEVTAAVNAATAGRMGEAQRHIANAVRLNVEGGMDEKKAQQAVHAAISRKRPESFVYRRKLTAGERATVYSRMTPENISRVERANAAIDSLLGRSAVGANKTFTAVGMIGANGVGRQGGSGIINATTRRTRLRGGIQSLRGGSRRGRSLRRRRRGLRRRRLTV